MQPLQNIKDDIKRIFYKLFNMKKEEVIFDFTLDYPKNNEFGDMYTNIAMVGAKFAKQKPLEIASTIKQELEMLDYISSVNIAGAGFINIKINKSFWQNTIKEVINYIALPSNTFGFNKKGNNEIINLEYVSANPTGPIHLGHTRGSVYGDVIYRLLTKNGYKVIKEYYINDAGVQVGKLTKSIFTRYLQIQGQNKELEDDCYPGEYLIDVAKDLLQNHGTDLDIYKDFEIIRSFSINYLMNNIKKSLLKLGIEHDVYTSEFAVIQQGYVDKVMQKLESQDLIYKGFTEKPKGQASKEWKEEEQVLFKSKQFGDDEDRVMISASGSKTYFVSDVAYQLHKIERGFKNLILVIGADHLGYVKRIKSATKALNNSVDLKVQLCQLVKFLKNGEPVKMSKRKGTFETLDDVLDEVPADIIRFIMISRKNDVSMDFDLEKVKEQSKDNEIFYIQYAYSRASSVLNLVKDFDNTKIDSSLLNRFVDLDFIKKVLEFPKVISIALNNLEPHHIVFYLYELAGCFHKLWHSGNEDKSLRFVVENDIITTNTRLCLAFLYRYIVDASFDIFGIKPIESM
jgi:arginyl-tRNA synthetase